MSIRPYLLGSTVAALGLVTGLAATPAHAKVVTCAIIGVSTGDVTCSSEDGDEAKLFINTTKPGGKTIVGSIGKNNGPNDVSLTANVSVEPPSQGFGEIKPTTKGDAWQTADFAPIPGSAFAWDGIFPDMQIIDSGNGNANKFNGDLWAVITDVSNNVTTFEWTGLKTDADLNDVIGVDELLGTSGIAIKSADFLLAGTLPNGTAVNSNGFFKSMKQIEVSNCLASQDCTGGGGMPPIPEPSTWVMLMLGFTGLGFLGYRKANRGKRTLFAA